MKRIVTNFCTGVGVHDVITCADLYYDRLRCVGVAGGQILAVSIDLLRCPYNTLAQPCECVIYCPVLSRPVLVIRFFLATPHVEPLDGF